MFKRYFMLLALMCALPIGVVQAEVKIGFVNAAKLLKEAPQAVEASERIKKEFEPRQKQLAATRKKLRDQEERLNKEGLTMGAAERSKLERELLAGQREFRLDEAQLRDDLTIRNNDELAKVQDTLREAIQAVGKEQNYDLILFEGVSYASTRVDITDLVLQKLKK